jgi:hyperosmotically inducible periplasmic protein
MNMFKRCTKQIPGIGLALLLFVFVGTSPASNTDVRKSNSQNKQITTLTQKVRHELVMLSDLGVFDNLSFTVANANTVVLTGQVVRPLLKADAETAVSRIPGISKVENNIEVLPLSSSDDSIRERAYRAVYRMPDFEKYAIQATPPIRIIVKNGTITLEGVVNDMIDKTKAAMAAKLVPGVFSVRDDLRID